MALATRCPHCNTTFRVAQDQLKLRGGIVRCGACNEIFDGNATLIDLASLHQPGAPPPPPAPSPSAAFDAEIEAIEAAVKARDSEPVYTLDFDTTFDPYGILPKSAPPEPQPEAAPEPEPQFAFEPEQPAETGPELEAEPGAEAVSGTEPEVEPAPEPEGVPEPEPMPAPEPEPEPIPEPEPEPGSEPEALPELPELAADIAEENAPADETRTEHEFDLLVDEPSESVREEANAVPDDSAGTAFHIEDEPADEVSFADEVDVEEPGFVKRARRKERAGRVGRVVMGIGSLLLLALLLAQGATTFRNHLAAYYPQLKPALETVCKATGCRVELPAQIDLLSIETGELQTLGGDTFAFTTLLRNAGSVAQAWPHLELVLIDVNDQPLVRRVFAPRDYIAPPADLARGFAPRSEQAVKLHFALSQVKASGYRIAVFYP